VAAADGHRWIDLIDPTAETLAPHLPPDLHPAARTQLLAPPVPDHEPRPRIESQGDYVFGVLLVPIALPDEDRVYYQEVDFVLTREQLLTVSKTSPGEQPFDPKDAQDACRPADPIGLYLFHLVDEVADRYLDLIDALNDEIDELEDEVENWRPGTIRGRISSLRHDLIHVRRTLSPTRDAVRRIVDNRAEIDDYELFPREVELYFADVYDKLLRSTEALETSRDLVAGVRDYFQSKIAIDQNEVMKRLTMVASLLLLPTFIVGLYGQNFHNIPELAWTFGYWWSWGWIIATTIAQIAFFRWKRWL
jgi:magnesium transporter